MCVANTHTELIEVLVDIIEPDDIPLFQKYRGIGPRLKFLLRQTMENHDDRDTAYPGCADFRPYIRALQSPWRKKHKQFMGVVQEIPYIFLELCADIDIRLVQESVGLMGS
ncbi:MAG: hypothetical protein BECKG1743D_GA0114223_105293 [Candidatus Kentron sp. G]|nr:MAG: hypothetical protein BECKG1743F_GA0114225_105153 [Candidatus Kentron sp. G]VFN02551.1 MAG: hypothetical protein BECKG1743E_GA0114224_105183 [Candidatus Kentron sp. G]VFN03925.1 MAG: hypothetical protein BECKG1743D_GA0114223_105293 [Candidatus Kentron sp. G]